MLKAAVFILLMVLDVDLLKRMVFCNVIHAVLFMQSDLVSENLRGVLVDIDKNHAFEIRET